MSESIVDWRQAFRDADALPDSASAQEKAARGRQFERLLSAMFDEADLRPRLSYRPTGEEIDGSIWFEGRTILIEAKWTSDPQPASSLYQFKGKVDGKLVGTLGLFISVGGYSPDAVDALVAGKELNIVLADGDDIRTLVDSRLMVVEALTRKLRAAGDSGTPFLSLEVTPDIATSPLGNRVVVVEGQVDARYLRAAQRLLGAPTTVKIVAAGGPSNIPPLLESLVESGAAQSILVVVDANWGAPTLEELKRELRSRSHVSGAEIQLVAIRPDLETALGLAAPDQSFGSRDWLRKPSSEQVTQLLRDADLRHRASNDPLLHQVLDAIGIDLIG
ncbi:hypothetical protein ABIC47_000183 [Leifsonia sp. 563]|uniref:restriction endonuclease n=1 Tax=Leifsonia sp. 563 TaxID=3156412 RepID=UPI0033955099